MSIARTVLRGLLGRRLPVTAGRLSVTGLHEPVRIDRDRFGVPTIAAGNEADAFFGVGFCQGQDRPFQLELLRRAVRGTLAELLGPSALPVDRVSRRVDFRRCAEDTVAAGDGRAGPLLAAFVRGINAGATHGLRRRPHELALLRSGFGDWEPADVVGLSRLVAFMLPSNWDQEFVRLKLLLEDGPGAVAALDGPYPPDAPAHDAPGAPAGTLADPLLADLEACGRMLGLGGASNAWALAGERTASGLPLLACDPHLGPTVPPHWYLVHVRTPTTAVAGAVLAGTPAVLAGHNGHGAWGLTIAPLDVSDLVIEQLDGEGVLRGTERVACRRRNETIAVRGAEPVTLATLESPAGPIISPELPDCPYALALRATWLRPHPIDGLVTGIQHATTFAEFRAQLRGWGGVPCNFVWAERAGTIGWQTVGTVPRRRRGHGVFPEPGWDPEQGWDPEPLPFDELPYCSDPASGFVVSANHLPTASEGALRFGRDWLDGYRARRIEMVLARRTDWDAAGCRALQHDDVTLSWWELRDAVLAAPVESADARLGQDLLARWGGRLGSARPGATVFAFLVAELTRRLVQAAAPRTARWALGAGLTPLTATNFFPKRFRSLLVQRVRAGDRGPLARPWPEEIADALGAVVASLRARYGPDPAAWAWNAVAAWPLPHVLGRRRPLDRVFNLGPLPGVGDQTTPAQHNRSFADPALPPLSYPSLRVVVDLADWDATRVALPGGQSGNPLSAHYDDQLAAYRSGAGIPLPWSPAARAAAVERTLHLAPA